VRAVDRQKINAGRIGSYLGLEGAELKFQRGRGTIQRLGSQVGGGASDAGTIVCHGYGVLQM